MILLKSFDSCVEAENYSDRLRRKGIYTYVSSKQSTSLSAVSTGALTSEVWVVFRNQHEDAITWVGKHSHKIQHKFTKEEMEYLDSQSRVIIAIMLGRVFDRFIKWCHRNALQLVLLGIGTFISFAIYSNVGPE